MKKNNCIILITIKMLFSAETKVRTITKISLHYLFYNFTPGLQKKVCENNAHLCNFTFYTNHFLVLNGTYSAKLLYDWRLHKWNNYFICLGILPVCLHNLEKYKKCQMICIPYIMKCFYESHYQKQLKNKKQYQYLF